MEKNQNSSEGVWLQLERHFFFVFFFRKAEADLYISTCEHISLSYADDLIDREMKPASSIRGASSVPLKCMNKKHVLADWGFVCAVAAVFIACSCLLVQSCPELRPLCTHQAQLKAE